MMALSMSLRGPRENHLARLKLKIKRSIDSLNGELTEVKFDQSAARRSHWLIWQYRGASTSGIVRSTWEQ